MSAEPEKQPDQKTIKIVGISLLVIVGFVVLLKVAGPIIEAIKNLFESLGFTDSEQDILVEDLIENGQHEDGNPWNPQTWVNTNPKNYWTWELFDEQHEPDGTDANGYREVPMIVTEANSIFIEINNQMGYVKDDFDNVMAIIQRDIKTKSDWSFVCWVQQKYNRRNLLLWMQGAVFPIDRLSNEEIATINSYLNKLPA
jgi:hypothetical protein